MELREIPGFDGYYGITADGRVWSYISKRFLKLRISLNGHYRVGLRKNGIQNGYLVHRLVVAVWGDLDLNDTQSVIHHLNGNPLDNRLDNLWIMNRSEHLAYHNRINAKGYKQNTDIHKLCTCCGELKLRSEFNVLRNNPDGLQSWCRLCRNEFYNQNRQKAQEYWKRNKTQIIQKRRERRQNGRTINNIRP